jgi:hypothetical protein
MKACGGDLIALCDQDDVWHPDKLAVCEQPFQMESDVSLVIHSARVVDEHLRPIASYPSHRFQRRSRLSAGSLPPFPPERCGFMMTFRSSFVKAADAVARPRFSADDGDRMTHDAWVSLVCGALGAVVLLPDELVLHRRHPSTATQRAWRFTMPAHRRRSPAAVAGRIRHFAQPSLELRAQEVGSYLARSSMIRERSAYLESLRPLARDLGHSACIGLERTIDSHYRYAQAMERRAAAYAKVATRARALRVACHTLRGDYGRRSKGGLGLASLMRDVTLGLRSGTAPIMPTNGRSMVIK